MLEPYKGNIIAKRIGSSSVTTGGAIKTASTEEKSLKVEIVSANIEDLKTGDVVVIKKYTGDEYDDNGEICIFITEDDILARSSK